MGADVVEVPTERARLTLLRERGDLRAQRAHVWEVVARLTQRASGNVAEFESWHGEGETFAMAGRGDGVADSDGPPARGIHGFSRGPMDFLPQGGDDHVSASSAESPLLTYTLYNESAYQHIRSNGLYSRGRLMDLQKTPTDEPLVVGERTIPSFPASAIVLKSVWWPVAPHGLTPLPVWDPQVEAPRRGGNDYTTWHRVVAIDPELGARCADPLNIDFAGQSFHRVKCIDIEKFHHVKIDKGMTDALALDPSANKAAWVVLGRPLRPGDYLVLIGANLATKEIDDWVWAALWWHDRPEDSPFSADRPAAVNAEWKQYLLQVAFDETRPTEVDGGPHIAFNPWLEGRFPDAGHGGGTSSNCLACHRRASFPAISFLPVTRGTPDLINDPAFERGRVRTGFIWSIALHARSAP